MMDEFSKHAGGILADTNDGLTGKQIHNYFNDFSVKFDRKLKFNELNSSPSKTVLFDWFICRFSNEEQFYIIDEMCCDKEIKDHEKVKRLRADLHKKKGGIQ